MWNFITSAYNRNYSSLSRKIESTAADRRDVSFVGRNTDFDVSLVVDINLYTAFENSSTCLPERLQWNVKVTAIMQQSYEEGWSGGPTSGIMKKNVEYGHYLRKTLIIRLALCKYEDETVNKCLFCAIA